MVKTSISIRLAPDVRSTVEQVARKDGRAFSNLLTKIVTDWARLQQSRDEKPAPNKENPLATSEKPAGSNFGENVNRPPF